MLLLDSSFLVAVHNETDAFHEAALPVMERIVAAEWSDVLLLDYVFLEVVTVLAARRGREAAVDVGRLLIDSREVRHLNGSDLFLDAFDEFRSARGHSLSFADTAIVAAARRLGVRQVATFDSDFRGIEGIETVP